MCLQSTHTSPALAESPAWKDMLSPPEHSPATLIDVRVPMRDGVSLSADVYPDGKAVNLWDGILRARYRDPATIRAGVPSPGQSDNPKLLKPGKTDKFFVEVGVVSNVFLKCHKIRVEVSSSNFPRFDRNLNNGGKLGVDTEIVIANQTVYHDAEHPSHILLPVIPER